MVSKKLVIGAVLIVGLAVFSFVFLKPSSQPSESVIKTTSIQNPYIEEYSLPSGSAPNGLIVDKHGMVWIASSASSTLYSLDPASYQIKNYEIKNNSSSSDRNSTMVWTILQDRDGFIWFSPIGTKSIWRFDQMHGTFDKFQSETGSAFQMKSNNNGAIWYTTLCGNTLGVIQRNNESQTGYKITAFNLGNDTAPAGLYLKNNSVWVSEITTQKIIEYTIDKQGDLVNGITKISEFPSNNNTILSSPTDILVGGNTIWLTEHGTSFLTEYNMGSDTVIRYPTSQNVFHAITLPFWIRGINDDHDLWFNEHEGNKLAYFDTVNRTMIEYNIPSKPKDGYLTYPLNIATDPNDNMILWFSEWNTDKIGKINGHIAIPYSLSTDVNQIILSKDASKVTIVNLDVNGQSPYNMNKVFINASSSVAPEAGFGDIDVKISPSILDLSSNNKAQLFLQNYAAPPGNYTLGISVSDGFAVKTIFLDLIVPKG